MPEVKARLLPERGALHCPSFGQRASSGKRPWIRPRGPEPLKKPQGPTNPVSYAITLPDIRSKGRLAGSRAGHSSIQGRPSTSRSATIAFSS